MQAPLQIAFRNVESSEEIKRLIEEKVAWLERISDRITSCRVVLEGPAGRPRRANQYRVHIDIEFPGTQIVVNRDPPRQAELHDLSVLIREAFESARHQLEMHVHRRNG